MEMKKNFAVQLLEIGSAAVYKDRLLRLVNNK